MRALRQLGAGGDRDERLLPACTSAGEPVGRDATLEWHILVKLCHELREAQLHAIVLKHHGAPACSIPADARSLASSQERRNSEIYLPMARSDIADDVGFSLAAVSRSFRKARRSPSDLLPDRRHLLIADHHGLASLIA
jgi:CRP/FNR family transcriptional regulator, anaerobic regulatory protein